MSTIYEVLNDADDFDYDSYEYDYEYNEYYDYPEASRNPSEEEVETLYKYFVDKGVDEEISWRIKKEIIYGSLRRNNCSINESGADLDKLLSSNIIDIREYYIGDTVFSSMEGQEWLINPTEGMFLLYKDEEVLEISEFCGNHLTLDKVLTHEYRYKCIHISHNDIFYGMYKLINEEKKQYYLEKEYKKLCNDYDIICKDRESWCASIWQRLSYYENQRTEISEYHENNCSVNAKLQLVGKFDLPVICIKKITEYGIQSNCNHYWEMQDISDSIDDINEIIDRDYKPYNNIKYKKEIAFHVLNGTYDEWLNEEEYLYF